MNIKKGFRENALEDVREQDDFGRIEAVGVEFIPEADRNSSPRNIFTVFVGGNMSLSVILFGWLPLTLGLSWSEAMTASFSGLFVGALLVAPMALFGPRTGTNNPVSSGAHFGVRGRLVSSILNVTFAVFYIAIAVWISGDALVYGLHRLLGTPDNNLALTLGYIAISTEFVILALYGHGTVVAVQKFVVPVAAVLLLLGVFAYAGEFDPGTRYSSYVLGGFWPTWLLAFSIALGGPLSYAGSFGDFTRRVSHEKHSDIRVALAAAGGVFIGLGITTLYGGFTAASFGGTSGSYVHDLISNAPLWYVIPILLIGLGEGVGHGTLDIYGSGLDLESIFPRISRVQATLLTSVVSLGLMFIGIFVFDAAHAVTAMTIILNALAGAMLGIMSIGFFVARRGIYDPLDLQVFNQGLAGGRYWFNGGWNPRAVVPFILASVVGVMLVGTSLYSGPLSGIAGGVDISFVVAIVIAALGYLLALRLWPEDQTSSARPAEQPGRRLKPDEV